MPPYPQLAPADVIAVARRWIGTPYHHQAATLGAGVDCVGLVRGVWDMLYATPIAVVASYSRDWAEATGEETLLAAARRHLVEVDPASLAPGQVVVFRYRQRAVAKHAGILASSPFGADAGCGLTLIHAVEGAPVSEVPLLPWWRRRVAAAFTFPGITH